MSCYLDVLQQWFQWIIHEAGSWNECFIYCPPLLIISYFPDFVKIPPLCEATVIKMWCRYLKLREEENPLYNKIRVSLFFSQSPGSSTFDPCSWFHLFLNLPDMLQEFLFVCCHPVSIKVFIYIFTKWRKVELKISQNYLCVCNGFDSESHLPPDVNYIAWFLSYVH